MAIINITVVPPGPIVPGAEQTHNKRRPSPEEFTAELVKTDKGWEKGRFISIL